MIRAFYICVNTQGVLWFLGHETPLLQTFEEEVECFGLLQLHLHSWC